MEGILPPPFTSKFGKACEKANSSDTAGFGDGPQKQSLFVALQVPFRYRTISGETLLVLEKVQILYNGVGLLGSKANPLLWEWLLL